MGIPPYLKEFCDAIKGTIDEKECFIDVGWISRVHVGGELPGNISTRSGALQGSV